MKKLKGKCKTCFGCEMLNDFGFKGRKKCKNYIRANENYQILYVILFIEILLYIVLLGYFYTKFNMLCGG